MNRLLLPLLLLGIACGDDAPSVPQDGGQRADGGQHADGGQTLDGGPASDGGQPTDGGPAPMLPCSPGSYEGNDAWTDQLIVRPGDQLCAYAPDVMPENNGRLRHAIRLKGTIVPQPGTYALPSRSGNEALRIPACLVDGDTATPIGAVSNFMVERTGGIGIPEGDYVTGTFPAGDAELAVSFFRRSGAETYDFAPPLGGADSYSFHQDGVTATRGTGDDERFYGPCTLPTNRCLRLRGDGVDIRLDEYNWAGSPGLGFAAGQRLSGTFDGQEWSIEGYENISTLYTRHAFGRSHFFAFEAPTSEGHCGLRLDVGDQYEPSGVFIAYADCEGQPRGAQVALTEEWLECE